jgi:hypothetical protein
MRRRKLIAALCGVRCFASAVARSPGGSSGGIIIVLTRGICLAGGLVLSACGSAVVQSEGSPHLALRPVSRIGAYVTGPDALVRSFQADIAVEAARHGLTAENVTLLFPSTRPYADAQIRQGLAAHAIDSVMIIKIGNAPGPRQYDGTILQERSPRGSGSAAATVASVNGDPSPTTFSATLIDAASGRRLWDGDGQIATGAFSILAYGTTAADAVAALFGDLQEKRIIGQTAVTGQATN